MNTTGELKDKRMEVVSKKLYVRYMVSLRCKLIVREQLKKLNIKHSISVQGAIIFLELVTEYRLNELKQKLKKHGLILLNEQESMLIDKMINMIIEVVHYTDELPKMTFDDLIDHRIGNEKESILKIFSDVKGMSVLQFIVNQKIERAKELLVYEGLSLSEIAEKLNYKNEALFISQFKKLTGLHPDYFSGLKKQRENNHTQAGRMSGTDTPARSIRSN